MTESRTVIQALAAALQSVAKGNSHAATPAAAVLWPDKECQWQAATPALKGLMPRLCELGAYDPNQRRGPPVWLKCAIAGSLPEIRLDGVPVVYLAGVSRAEFRPIKSCPRDLQPLAEMQYRGVFWSQVNAKDWTRGAFLAPKSGGLSLDVAQDKATQDALLQPLQAGVLRNRWRGRPKGTDHQRIVVTEHIGAQPYPRPAAFDERTGACALPMERCAVRRVQNTLQGRLQLRPGGRSTFGVAKRPVQEGTQKCKFV